MRAACVGLKKGRKKKFLFNAKCTAFHCTCTTSSVPPNPYLHLTSPSSCTTLHHVVLRKAEKKKGYSDLVALPGGNHIREAPARLSTSSHTHTHTNTPTQSKHLMLIFFSCLCFSATVNKSFTDERSVWRRKRREKGGVGWWENGIRARLKGAGSRWGGGGGGSWRAGCSWKDEGGRSGIIGTGANVRVGIGDRKRRG